MKNAPIFGGVSVTAGEKFSRLSMKNTFQWSVYDIQNL